MSYRRKTDDEVTALAKRIYRHEVFVSWMMSRPEDLPSVFMILSLMDPADAKQMVADDIQFLYEDYHKAAPMSCNGQPIFFSFGMLSGEDGHRVHAKVQQIAELVG